MTIYLDNENNKTICCCDCCGEIHTSPQVNGVAPGGWVTGQIWLNVSLSEQKQVAIVFCLDCSPIILSSVPNFTIQPKVE